MGSLGVMVLWCLAVVKSPPLGVANFDVVERHFTLDSSHLHHIFH